MKITGIAMTAILFSVLAGLCAANNAIEIVDNRKWQPAEKMLQTLEWHHPKTDMNVLGQSWHQRKFDRTNPRKEAEFGNGWRTEEHLEVWPGREADECIIFNMSKRDHTYVLHNPKENDRWMYNTIPADSQQSVRALLLHIYLKPL
ncbi:hypothetical protein PCANC_05165 [Puccinia coronata f. sp. avenae]|jgi:hypothetical protein|nr:hypothetical protein PCANC_22439 [Puccinia coronata f. sp. avenae]PLW40106.1 hypothetical protein PCASD_07847 [Puccinia coronata f. sp. avenae]PLW56664.1 hypothetical protein PCANC_05165 [Puccinia coronata f. sp. avenae]